MVAIFRTIPQILDLQARERDRFPELNTVSLDMSLRINAQRTADRRELTQFGNRVLRAVDPRPLPPPPPAPRPLVGPFERGRSFGGTRDILAEPQRRDPTTRTVTPGGRFDLIQGAAPLTQEETALRTAVLQQPSLFVDLFGREETRGQIESLIRRDPELNTLFRNLTTVTGGVVSPDLTARARQLPEIAGTRQPLPSVDILRSVLGGLDTLTNIGAGVVRDPFGTASEILGGDADRGFSVGRGLAHAQAVGASPTGIEGAIPGTDIRFDVGREAARVLGDPLNLVPGLGLSRQALGSAVRFALRDIATTARVTARAVERAGTTLALRDAAGSVSLFGAGVPPGGAEDIFIRALREQAELRATGAADERIAALRARQLEQNLQLNRDLVDQGLTNQQIAAELRASLTDAGRGAGTRDLIAPLDLSDEAIETLTGRVLESVDPGFSQVQLLRNLDDVIQGVRVLSEEELAPLGRIFGEDFGPVLREANEGRRAQGVAQAAARREAAEDLVQVAEIQDLRDEIERLIPEREFRSISVLMRTEEERILREALKMAEAAHKRLLEPLREGTEQAVRRGEPGPSAVTRRIEAAGMRQQQALDESLRTLPIRRLEAGIAEAVRAPTGRAAVDPADALEAQLRRALTDAAVAGEASEAAGLALIRDGTITRTQSLTAALEELAFAARKDPRVVAIRQELTRLNRIQTKLQQADRRIAAQIEKEAATRLRQEARREVVQSRQVRRQQERLAARREALNPNAEQALNRVLGVLATPPAAQRVPSLGGASPAVAAREGTAQLLPQQRQLTFLERVGFRLRPDDPDLVTNLGSVARVWFQRTQELTEIYARSDDWLRGMSRFARGQVADSQAAFYLSRQAVLRDSLVKSGVGPEMADAAARAGVKAELARRFGPNVPEGIRASLRTAQARGGVVDQGINHFVAVFKNTAFGAFDAAIFGLHLVRVFSQGGIPAMAALINRLLVAQHLPGAQSLYAEAADLGIPRAVWRELNGVHQGGSHVPGASVWEQGAGTVVGSAATLAARAARRGPEEARAFGRRVDVPAALGDLATEAQYGHALTWARNLVAEGNLVLMHLAGVPLDAQAWRVAADHANALSLFSQAAQRGGRRTVEKATLISPSQTRARFALLEQVANTVLNPRASRAERVVGLTTVASTAASMLLAGKLINDRFGITPFIFDPSDPDFAQIHLPEDSQGNSQILRLFGAAQLERTIGRVFAELAAEDFEGAAEQVVKFWGSRSTPFGGAAVEATTGGRFVRGLGFRFGAPGTAGERLLNLAPLPPIFGTMLDDGFDLSLLGPEAIGVTTFEEGGLSRADRKAVEFAAQLRPADPGSITGVRDLTSPERDRLDQLDPQGEVRAAQEDRERARIDAGAAARTQARTAQEASRQDQLELDDLLSSKQLTPRDWREARSARLDEIRAFLRGTYGPAPIEPDADSPDFILQQYYQQIQRSDSVLGVDWDAVETWVLAQDPIDQRFIETATNSNPDRTPKEQEYRADIATLDAAGFFDIRDRLWTAFQQDIPVLRAWASYGDWRMAAAREFLTGDRDDTLAWDQALDRADQLPLNSEWTRFLQSWNRRWDRDHPEAAVIANKWQFISRDPPGASGSSAPLAPTAQTAPRAPAFAR